MTKIPRPAAGVMPQTSSQLRRMFPGWQFAYDPVHHVWTGERVTGSAVRFVAAFEAFHLAAKIGNIEAAEAAEAEQFPRSVARASGPDWRDERA